MKNQRLVSSKLLDRKWREQEQMIHKRKLREVQSAVRCHQKKPYAPSISMRNAKKEAMLERKLRGLRRLAIYEWTGSFTKLSSVASDSLLNVN